MAFLELGCQDNGEENTTRNLTSSESSTDKYSDTPQGTVNNLSNDTYLTNARMINGGTTEGGTIDVENSNTNHVEEDVAGSGNSSRQFHGGEKVDNDTTENYIESRVGKTSGYTYSKMLKEYRETLLNIDMMFINEFEELFMQIW